MSVCSVGRLHTLSSGAQTYGRAVGGGVEGVGGAKSGDGRG